MRAKVCTWLRACDCSWLTAKTGRSLRRGRWSLSPTGLKMISQAASTMAKPRFKRGRDIKAYSTTEVSQGKMFDYLYQHVGDGKNATSAIAHVRWSGGSGH